MSTQDSPLVSKEQKSAVLKQFVDFVCMWDFHDARRWQPEFYLAWLTVMGRRTDVDVEAARVLYRERKASLTCVDTELLRILIVDIGAFEA